MKNKVILILTFLFFTNLHANELELDLVIKSTKSFFPTVLNSLDKIKESESAYKVSEGAFDLELKSDIGNRAEGYYDGDYFDVVLEKPLKYMNSKLYIGHRKSENIFPVYEGQRNTLDQGESRVGIQISLWRNRDIDPKRLKLRNNKIKIKQSEQDFLYKESKILKDATKAYWNWVAKGFIYKINKDLLVVMETQLKGIQKKIKLGALARIYETENLQYIMKRKTEVAKSLQEFKEASILLSLFFRDMKGNPLVPTEDLLPKEMKNNFDINKISFSKELENIIDISPKLRSLKLKDIQLENELLEAGNSLAPKLDLKMEVSQDQGRGDKVLEEQEKKVMLQLSIPIERNIGNGRTQQAKIQRRMVSRKRQLERNNLSVKFNNISTRIATYSEVIKNTAQEVKYSILLQKAERKKFERGSSDFFIVNLRDQNVASAQIKLVESKYKLSKTIAEYKALTMSF
jgi:cobalt-zinc-cadmium efflux system outer membrane protein